MTRSQNKQQQLEQAKDIVINSIGQTMDLYGTNRSVGNLYGTMVFEGSMTLDKMRHQLQMSKPSMSAGVKKLQEFDIVKQQFTRGSRKQHFIAEKDFFIFFRNFFTKKFQREIDINVEAVKDAQAIINPLLESSDLTEAETQEAQKIKAQLDHTHVYYEWLEQLTEAIESGEIFKYFPIPEQPSDSEN
ncbi:TPA: GbsR/MarR family transcriptional regulator [Staphylococcus aureus]|uniref:choline uptake/conversion transcriptional regulator CudC n=1 Tax=Staphylococcus aureus TaxID=1280 RepID=UPI001362C8B3|nr:GbsR/MarR family transcriptional regulator [Staphylococcus aureus]QHK76345.1 GbsR/MarR family transcriptional regulator [Staphylococcus aureus]HCG2810632.1 GbsR/MarR family transcriptional regulator [Staphylococcus aureus]HCZ0370545.1 GbsR/MarR family transcriptional regulator [Staphylococcus aureus]HDF6930611.1 GbsR/MarR family transcriptional regulator [Staphylococcus aureus]HDF8031196.1 GbsR/MarR family transcriptional regulator [Staphylococcus aureus]